MSAPAARTPATVLILGGTGEARRLASLLTAETPRLRVVSSLAGRTTSALPLAGEVRVGGFGGAAGLARWLRGEDADAVVDATHPFASKISAAVATAAAECGVPLVALRRPGWTAGPGDRWHWVDSLDAAAHRIDRLGERVLLTVGRQGVAAFAGCTRHWFLARCLEPPEPPLPPRLELLLERGPFPLERERELLRSRAVDVVVSKDSGGAATAAKLAAAREAGIPVVMVRRPPLPDVPAVADVAAAAEWLRQRPAAAAPEGEGPGEPRAPHAKMRTPHPERRG